MLATKKSTLAIESFEHEMATAAAYITLQRNILVKDLEFLSGSLHETLVGKNEILNFQYKTHSVSLLELELLKKFHLDLFKKNRPREIDFGVTLAGPHKDDLGIFLNKKEARQFASEGQQRSTVSSLRLSEWMRLKRVSESSPLMLIDDLGISLDHGQKKTLNPSKQLKPSFSNAYPSGGDKLQGKSKRLIEIRRLGYSTLHKT